MEEEIAAIFALQWLRGTALRVEQFVFSREHPHLFISTVNSREVLLQLSTHSTNFSHKPERGYLRVIHLKCTFEYLKRRGFDVCQNMNYSARNCQSESLNLTSLALPPGKRNIKRNLKTTSNVEKTPLSQCGQSVTAQGKRDITLFEENASCIRKRINLDSRGDNNTLLLWLPKFGEIAQGRGQGWRHTPV